MSVNKAFDGLHDVRDIIENKKLTASFQQIVSISRKTVVGVEGLIRYTNPQTGENVSPGVMFEQARAAKLSLEMDRACREEILEEFCRVHRDNPDKLLFLNMNLSILEYCAGSGYLLDQVKQRQINPRNIVIEISELNVLSNTILKKFVDTYKRYGFMVALDDVGTGFSNMDRILLVKPDIIKIDISLVKNIHLDFYKQGVFKALVILANKIGALVIAEGVELEEEAMQVIRLGSHMIQGFYFSVPSKIADERKLFLNNIVDRLSRRYNEYIRMKNLQERDKNKQFIRVVNQCVSGLTGNSFADVDALLEDFVCGCELMECAYILDSNGIQISKTFCNDQENKSQENLIFYSANIGTDHSMEKYFYPLTDKRKKRCTTEPYISLATGNLCVTISSVFSLNGERCILCADFKTNEELYNIELSPYFANQDAAVQKDMNGILTTLSEELITDSLTGAYNRRYIEEKLPVDMYSAATHDKPLALLLVDVDHFKQVNDRFGHRAGDQVLQEFVKISKRCFRKETDWVARYGGDEFLFVLSGAKEAGAMRVAEAIRAGCERAEVFGEEGTVRFTVSLGICTIQDTCMTIGELIGQADKNLYTAKKLGRNQAVQTSVFKQRSSAC